MSTSATLAGLRARLHALHPPSRHGVLPFGDARVDSCLPGGGLSLGALHEVAAAGIEGETGAATAGFAASLLARLPGMRPVFWIAPVCDLHPPGLLGFGLDPGRLILVRTADDDETLAATEAILRSGAAEAVVAEAGRLGRIASRRLQLACLDRGSTGFVLRRSPWGRKGEDREATAAVTRWRLTPAPSLGEIPREPGKPRWVVELTHSRGGTGGAWLMEAGGGDAADPLRVVAVLADTAPAPAERRNTG
jgi:protein ImuA